MSHPFPSFDRAPPLQRGNRALTCESLSTDGIPLPIADETPFPLTEGMGSVMFVVKENRKSFPPEWCVESIGWFWLSLACVLGVRRGTLSFMESSLSSLFLLFLAGQFFPSLFAFINPSAFCQDTLLFHRSISQKAGELQFQLKVLFSSGGFMLLKLLYRSRS
jgi:hypothetical protein